MKNEKLEEIVEEIKACRKCSLWKTRKNPVPGEGNINAEIMVVGLGPGFNEDRLGRPFVGRAGKFLDELLTLIGIKRKEIYITNVIKCFLPDNIATNEQIKACTPYLDKQLATIKPRIIITLGNVATSYILKKFGLKPINISKVHGKIFEVNSLLGKIKIIPMYHPATALYNPRMKEILRKDWKNIEKEVGLSESKNKKG
jgi:DNA polymerase